MKPISKYQAKTLDSFGETRKVQQRSLQENHQEILNNLQSTIIGKPTIVEAQRVLKVIDHLIANLETFIYLDAEFVSRFSAGRFQKELIQNLSEDTLQLLQKEAEIEQKYKPYATMDQAIKEGEEIDETRKAESERLEALLQENFKNLLRNVQREDLTIIKQLKVNTNPELNDLVHCVKCVRIVMLKKLSTAEEEQKNHIAQLDELKIKIDSYEKTKNQCEQDLLKHRQERAKNTNEKKEEIERLRAAIQEVKATKKKQQEMLGKDVKTKIDGLEKLHKTSEDKLIIELNALKAKFTKMKDDNTADETTSKRKKTAQDTSLAEAIYNYDQLMEDKTKQLSELEQECAQIEKQLKDKQDYFRSVDSEKGREREIEEEFAKKKEMHKIDLEKRWEAARHIQAFINQVKKPSKKGGKKPKK